MELSSADQIEQEFADELQNMSLQEKEAAPVSKPSLARGFSEIDPNNEAAARGTSAQKQGSFSARQLPDEPSYRVALQSRYGSVAPPLARTFTERDPSSPISPAPKLAPKPPARTFTEPERPFPPTEPANKDALLKAARELAYDNAWLARAFSEVWAHAEYVECSLELLGGVLERDDLSVESEEVALRALLRWADHQPEPARDAALPALLELIRWPTIPGEVLAVVEDERGHPRQRVMRVDWVRIIEDRHIHMLEWHLKDVHRDGDPAHEGRTHASKEFHFSLPN